MAIEHRTLEERTRGEPATRRVPVMLAKGWGGDESLGDVMCCIAPAAAAPTMGGGRALRKRIGGFFKRSMDIETLRDSSSVPESSLEDVLMRQTAEGWFPFGPTFARQTVNGQPWHFVKYAETIDAMIPSLNSELQGRVRGTALTLRAFQECYAAEEDLWRLAAMKGRRWLEKVAPEVARWCAGK